MPWRDREAAASSAVSPSASPIWSILTPAASERSGTAARSVSATGGEPFHATSASPVTSSFLVAGGTASTRSEEHTSELQSLMRISYAVFCLKKKKKQL